MSRQGKPSHIPLFRDAYLADTYQFSAEQHGLYLLLMLEAWDQPDCGLPDDDNALAAIGRMTVAKFRRIAGPVLLKWTRDGGRIYQKRLRKEWAYVQEKRTKAKAAIDARWDREKGYGRTTDVVHLGEGVGEDSKKNLYHEEEGKGLGTREAGPFSVIRGGAK